MKMLLSALLLFTFLGVGLKVEAQNEFVYFNKAYWTDTMNTLTQMAKPIDDGYLVFGVYVNEAGTKRMYLRKLNLVGNTKWVKTIAEENTEFPDLQNLDSGTHAVITSDNHIVLVYSKGDINSPNVADVYFVKLDWDGNVVWEKVYEIVGANYFRQVKEVDTGGFILAGFHLIEGEPSKMQVIRTDANGELLWRRYYVENWGQAFSVYPTWWDDGFIIGGASFTEENQYDMQIVKIDANGEVLWEKTIGSPENDCGCLVWPITTVQDIIDLGGIEFYDYLVSGCYENGNVSDDLYLSKINQFGDPYWERFYYPLNRITPILRMDLKKDKSFVGMAGYVNSSWNRSTALMQFNSIGEIDWYNTIDVSPENELYFKDMEPTADKGYVLAGFQNSPAPQKSWVVKIDSLGNTCSQEGCDSTVLIQHVTSVSAFGSGGSGNPYRVSINPNPVSQEATIQYYLPQDFPAAYLQVYSLHGELVKKKLLHTVNHKQSLDFSALSSGIYSYELVFRGKTVWKDRLFVE